jgi:hypothetical protein
MSSNTGYRERKRITKMVLCLEHCFIWLRGLDTKKIGAEVFGVLEENGEDKMVRESN